MRLLPKPYHYDLHAVALLADKNVKHTGDVFWTDANGMELVKRTRYKRNGFVAAELEHDTANPIGGNYYPITSSAAIVDETESQLIIVTDRGQGKAAAMAEWI